MRTRMNWRMCSWALLSNPALATLVDTTSQVLLIHCKKKYLSETRLCNSGAEYAVRAAARVRR